MNKKFLNVMLCSLLVGGVATNLVSCKDYDDDITEINTTTDSLGQQLKDLNAALQTANADAAAAKEAAAKANDAAAKALEEAKAAAAQAKAEALAEVISQVEALQQQINSNASLSKENAQALAALTGRINGIEQGLANIDLTDVNKQLGEQATQIAEANKQIQAIKTQIAALEAYGTDIKNLGAQVDDIKAQLAAIDSIKSQLESLLAKANANAAAIAANSTAIAANTAAINDLKAELNTLSGKISTEVANAVNTIAAVLSQRLTSVTLIPKLYIGGIPTIEFESAQYTKKVYDSSNHKWVDATPASKNTFTIDNEETEVKYRLNPATVTAADIIPTELAFVSQVATSRAGEVVNDLINVSGRDGSVNVENGVMTLKLGKSTTGSLNGAGDEINTVALRVPIAKNHLFTEQGETSANVYSEYTRLNEVYFTPEIAYVPGANLDSSNKQPYTVSDSANLYASGEGQMVAKNLVYNQSYNLYDLIEGYKFFGASSSENTVLSITELDKYGMRIEFAVATEKYTAQAPDNTNQQEWVKLSGENNSILTPVTNVSSGSLPNNQATIGKQPILRATLYDYVNNNVVEVRYFKVKFTAEDMAPVNFTWDIATEGKPCTGASVEMTWDQVADHILVNLNGGKGMSKEDFYKIYGASYTVSPANADNGTFVANVSSELSASVAVFNWSVTPEQLGKLNIGVNTKQYTKTVTFTNASGLYPDIVVKFNFTVTTKVDAVTLGTTDSKWWTSDGMMDVTVVPMEIPYVSGTSPKAHYATNILQGRNKPYVNGLTSCATYDVDYANNTGDGSSPLAFQTGYNHWAITAANQSGLNSIIYSIPNDVKGKAIASNGKEIVVEWKSNINGLMANPDNRFQVGTMTLNVLPILKLNEKSANAITDNTAVQSTQVAVTITDALGNLVAQAPTTDAPYAADYWDFYGIQNPTYNGVIQIANDAKGTGAQPVNNYNIIVSVDSTGKLTYQNNGSLLQHDAYLIVPVEVEHLWGTLTGTVAVPLKKNPNNN